MVWRSLCRGQIGFCIRLLMPFAQHFIQTEVGERGRKKQREREEKRRRYIFFSCRKRVLLCGFSIYIFFFFDDFISVHIGTDIGKVFFFLLFARSSSRMFMGDFFPVRLVCSLRMHESVLFAIRFVRSTFFSIIIIPPSLQSARLAEFILFTVCCAEAMTH